MWRDECGFKHNGPSPYEQRKLAVACKHDYRRKYKEKVEEACRWLNNFLYFDTILEILEFILLRINLKKKLLMISVK